MLVKWSFFVYIKNKNKNAYSDSPQRTAHNCLIVVVVQFSMLVINDIIQFVLFLRRFLYFLMRKWWCIQRCEGIYIIQTWRHFHWRFWDHLTMISFYNKRMYRSNITAAVIEILFFFQLLSSWYHSITIWKWVTTCHLDNHVYVHPYLNIIVDQSLDQKST